MSPATKKRVQDAAAALNYRPNRAAQRLVRGGGVTIGLVVDDLRNPYYPELAAEVTRRAAERDWGVIVTDLGGRHGDEHVEAALARVDAVVGHLAPDDRGVLTRGVPAVLLTDGPDETAAAVRFDYADGMRAAVDRLLTSGRRRIALIDAAGPPSIRGEVFRAAVHTSGRAVVATIPAEVTHDGGVAAAKALLATAPDADAVLCFNDVLAVGALKGFVRAGIGVPDDIAVIGVDGLEIGTLVTPELTTLAVDMGAVARHALDLVAALLAGGPADGRHETVGHTLLLRESA